jgi:chromosome partitioning protein
MKPNTIIFSNQKGGVGKTTLTRELGIYLASLGFNLLFVDCDPQGNLTKSLVMEEGIINGLYEALEGGIICFKKLDENTTLLAGDFRLAGLEKSLIAEIDCYTKLKELFDTKHFAEFDFIFLDTPPSLGVLTVNALTAADHLIIPMNPSLYSMQGTNDLMQTIAKVRKTLNPDLNLLGVIINAYDSIPVITRQIRQEIEHNFKEKIFETVLSRTIKLEEAIAEYTGVINLKHMHKSRAIEEVKRIGNELLLRLGMEGVKQWQETD